MARIPAGGGNCFETIEKRYTLLGSASSLGNPLDPRGVMAAGKKLSTQLDEVAAKSGLGIGTSTWDKGVENRAKNDQIRGRLESAVRDLKDTLK
jgi:hypothetical protein